MSAPVTFIGWAVVTSLWQGTLIAGIAALTLAALGRANAAWRDRVALTALFLMAVAPLVTVALGTDVLSPSLQRSVSMSVDRAIDLGTYLTWRARLVFVLGAIWIAGAFIGAIRLIVAWRRAAAIRVHATADAGDDVRAMVARVSAALGIAAPVDVRRSAVAGVPLVLGVAEPLIVLPEAAVASLTPAGLRSILAHELAHVQRRDVAANLAQLVVDAALFFHPAARWISLRIRIEREYCCDDVAVAVAGDRVIYARALATLDDARTDCRLAVAAASGTLVDRIARIAGRNSGTLSLRRGLMLMAGALVTTAILLVSAFAAPSWIPPGTQLRRRTAPPGFVPRQPPPGSAKQPMRRQGPLG